MSNFKTSRFYFRAAVTKIPDIPPGITNRVAEGNIEWYATHSILHAADKRFRTRAHASKIERYFYGSQVTPVIAHTINGSVCTGRNRKTLRNGRGFRSKTVGTNSHIDHTRLIEPAGTTIHVLSHTARLSKKASVQKFCCIFL